MVSQVPSNLTLQTLDRSRKIYCFCWVEPHVSELWFEPWALHSLWHWWQFDASLCRTRQCKKEENQWYMFVSPLSILLSPFLIHTLTYMFILHGTWAKMAWAKMATDQYIYIYMHIYMIHIYIYHYVYIHIHVIIPCSEGYSRSQLTAYAHLLEMHYGWEGALFQKKPPWKPQHLVTMSHKLLYFQ